jgi:hypothetical protein
MVNLAKGHIGEDSSSLLGGLLVTTIGLAAFSRADTPPAERRDFFVYIDEFQHLALVHDPADVQIFFWCRQYTIQHRIGQKRSDLVLDWCCAVRAVTEGKLSHIQGWR